MGTDSIVGNIKQAAGKAQEKLGEAINSPEQQAKGAALQAEGKIQETYGDAKDVTKDALRSTADKI